MTEKRTLHKSKSHVNNPGPSAYRSATDTGGDYSRSWGGGPSGLLGLVLVIVIVLFLLGHI